ncbi:porin [Gilvimarinus chinensis]|uniref:porin n=1 Tax=Gilvimarinus chinensis TaxID=396005 RepID=UPI000380BC97|nr:porin [Gilvimarinus chinensis]
MIPHSNKALALAVSALLCTSYATAQDNSADQRIEQLEQQLQTLQNQVNAPEESRLRFNGFLSIAYGMASNDGGYAGYTEEGTFNEESLFGLQGAFTLTDDTEVTMQLVGRGSEDWDPTIEWAYISHQFTPELKMRAGKMRLPLYMYSDSLEVGYAQPWIRPPEEVYGNVPITSYTGVDALYDVNFDMSTLTFQAFMGESEETISNLGQTLRLEVNDLFGGSATWTDFIWTVRGNYATAEITTGGDDLQTDFYGLGASYNNGSLQVISEFTRLEIEGSTPDTDSGYLTFAYTFGSLAPYFTYSMQESTDDDERPYSREFIYQAITTPGNPLYGNIAAVALSDVQSSERTAYSLGLRWDLASNVAVKFDVTRATDFGDTGGGLPGNIGPVISYDDIDVYTIKIDSAF